MANSIIKDIEQMIIKLYIVGPLMRSLQSGLGSFLPGAVTAGGVGAVSGLSGGGYTGPGGVHEPAGIVHKGEVVWSQSDVSRAGGVGVVEAMRQGARGYAEGGPVMPSNVVPMRRAANDGGGAVTNVNVITGGGQGQPKVTKTPNGTGGHDVTVDLRNFVLSTVKDGMVNDAAFAKAVNARTTGFKGS